MLDIVMRGGILMLPIAICSIIVVAIAVERYLTYKKLTVNVPSFMLRIRPLLQRKEYAAAINECASTRGPVSKVIRAGLERVKQGADRMKEAMETAGNSETYHIEKNLSVLATLAGITPLIGFLGTVTGMIKAFMKIQQLSGNVNADVLAGGIWEAMITTAAGLAVGIPAVILYNYFVHRVREFTFQMESAGEEMLDIITSTGKPTVSEPAPNEPEIPDVPWKTPGDTRLAGNTAAHDDDESFDPTDDSFLGGTNA